MNSQDLHNLQEAYLDVYELDEGAAENVANRAQKLANQKGQTPERKKIYQDLANKARERDEAQNPNPMRSVGSSRFEYNQKHGRPLITPEVSQSRSSQGTLGGVTYQRGPNRLPKSQRKYDRQVLSGVRAASEQEKQRARERMGIKEDIYDIILSHLLDEGYADTQEQAEVIMVNMSEDWRESICEGYKRFPYGRVEYQIQKKEDNPTGRGTPQSIKMGTVVRHFKGGKEIPPVEKREHSPQISKAREAENRARGAENRARERMGIKEDIYDIILSHLIDEGYADTQEQAEVIMVNMSEDWRESICEGYVPLRTSDDRYDDEGFPTTTRSWSNKMTDARIRVGKVKDRSRKNSGDPIGNLTKGVSAKKRLDAMKTVDDEPESVRANRSQAIAAANRQLGANRRSLQTSLDREHLTKSLKSS